MKNDANNNTKSDKFKTHLRFDARLLEWNLKYKVLQEKDIKDHASTLPDSADNVETFAIDDIA
ncbi:MAG: hypothetical protein AB7F59_11790 [Bdellovibrionales bacterium]